MLFLLADDQSKVRFALRVLLERQSGFRVLGEAADAGEMLALAAAVCPDVVLFDWELPGLDPEATLADLRDFCPCIRLVALSGLPEVEALALDAGVDAFVSKSVPPDRLLALLREFQGSTAAKPGGASEPKAAASHTPCQSLLSKSHPIPGALPS